MIGRFGTVALLLAGAASMSGCASFGGNVKGTFACAAPEMGSCAPSSVIDDRALAMIVGEAGDSQISPAGPYPTSSPEARSYQAAAKPSRTGEKVLRIVFPSHIDPEGRLHDQMSVHAVVDRGDWQSASSANAVARSPEEVAAATGGDTLLAAVERAETPIAEIDPDMPSADTVAAARARAQGAARAGEDPIGTIRDDVAKRLAKAPRRAQGATVRSSSGLTPSKPPSAIVTTALPAPATARPNSPAFSAAAPTVELPRSTAGTIIPAQATDKGRAAVEAVNQNPVIRSVTSSMEAEARSSKAASPVTTLRASPFPGLKGEE